MPVDRLCQVLGADVMDWTVVVSRKFAKASCYDSGLAKFLEDYQKEKLDFKLIII